MASLIVVEYHTRVEDALLVEESLYSAHNVEGLVAPFALDVGCHIAARTVLGLERAIVFVYNQVCHLLHQLFIASHLRLGRERLVDDEVVVALQSVAIDAGIVISIFVE